MRRRGVMVVLPGDEIRLIRRLVDDGINNAVVSNRSAPSIGFLTGDGVMHRRKFLEITAGKPEVTRGHQEA